MNNVSNLNAKDKMLIAKAIADIATSIYKDNTEFVLNQIIKNGNYESEFGQFSKRTTSGKTVQQVINDNNEKIAKLQAENAILNAEKDKNALVKEESTMLVSKHYANADDIATDLLQDILTTLDSKKLIKSAQKVIRK